MARYRKKPIVIEAFQWTGQPPREWPAWAMTSLAILYEISSLQVDTNHGPVRANKGDWLIKTEAGEIYPCQDDEFWKNYEVVS